MAAFGALAGIGVHQDGLAHVSAMAKTFVKVPREFVAWLHQLRLAVLGMDIVDDHSGGDGGDDDQLSMTLCSSRVEDSRARRSSRCAKSLRIRID